MIFKIHCIPVFLGSFSSEDVMKDIDVLSHGTIFNTK